MILSKVNLILTLLFLCGTVSAQDDVYREVTLEKYKLQSKIKNLLLKSSETQKNILFLEEEIREMKDRVVSIDLENKKISENIKNNFPKFSNELIKMKINDFEDKNIIRLQTFKNWNHDLSRVKELADDLVKTRDFLIKSQKDLRKSIVTASSIMIQVNNEVEELDAIQTYLRSDLEKTGPDSQFFKMVGKLVTVGNSRIIASKGFYKIPGERVYDYNEGLKFSADRGEPVYPIATGILEAEIYVPNLGQILIVKHTENIRSFYIGAATIPGVLINDHLSPDQQLGLVKSSVLELKLRFDTESLDPSEWVKIRR